MSPATLPTTPSGHRLQASLALLAVTFVWGATFPLVKSALADCTPLLFNLLRMLLAAALLIAINCRHLRSLTRPQLTGGALAGVLLAIGYEFQTAGLARTTPVRSAFLTGLVVILVPLLGAIPGIRKRGAARLTAVTLLGTVIAFVGIVLLTSHAGSRDALLGGLHLGEWLTLASAVAFAAHLLTLDRMGRQVSARALGTLQIAFCAAAMLVLLPLEPHASVHFTPRLVLALGTTAILATAAAFTIQSWAQQHLAPAPTALVLSTEPVFALLTSWLAIGEHLEARALLGAGLILAAILFTELQPRWSSGALARKDI